MKINCWLCHKRIRWWHNTIRGMFEKERAHMKCWIEEFNER